MVQNRFSVIFYRFSQQAWVFVDGNPFQLSVIFEGEAGTYLSETPVTKSNSL